MTVDIEAVADGLSSPPRSVGAALASLGGDPRQWIHHWNWKAALTSSLIRGGLFFAVNLTASLAAAQAALVTEFFLRAITSGFFGAVTQRFRRVEPRWAATATVSILLPVTSQTIELGVHWLRGTEALFLSVAASALITVGFTAFNLHLMRHGVLTVGADSQSLLHDLSRLPMLMLGFLGVGPFTALAAGAPSALARRSTKGAKAGTDADASPRISMSSARHGRRRWLSFTGGGAPP